MRVAILSPWSHLEEYSGQSNYHLTLAHLYKIPEYAKFYLDRFTQGDWVILDNGANEGIDIDDSELAHMALNVGVNEVVAPDQPRDGEESTERTLKFIATYGGVLRGRGKHIIGVPQGSSVRQWLHNFRLIAPYVDTMGISKKTEELNGDRICLVRMITGTIETVHHPIHLLGADRVLSWIAKYTMPRVRGVDTQKPFAAGLSGVELDHSTHKGEFKSVDLGAAVVLLPPEEHARINRNILRYRKWAGDQV